LFASSPHSDSYSPLAPYAVDEMDTRGRHYPEPSHPYRRPFARDRDRIIHSSAFRRLSQKTQVFTGDLGDYHRTRLTHTLEVASIGRTLARALRLNEDLVEALALLHDIGHPPFGHAGEEVLDDCLADHGGFNHNAQALRIVKLLETRYPDFPGLNLSYEVLTAQAHRIPNNVAGCKETPAFRSSYLEAQLVDAADSIAYNTHDVDDALVLGLLSLDQLADQPLWARALSDVNRRYSALLDDPLRRAVVRQLIEYLVGDCIEASGARLEAFRVDSVEQALRTESLVGPSDEVGAQQRSFEAFLFEHVYRDPDVMAVRDGAKQQLRAMFRACTSQRSLLPQQYQHVVESESLPRAAADYLASMTDRTAQRAVEKMVAE